MNSMLTYRNETKLMDFITFRHWNGAFCDVIIPHQNYSFECLRAMLGCLRGELGHLRPKLGHLRLKLGHQRAKLEPHWGL